MEWPAADVWKKSEKKLHSEPKTQTTDAEAPHFSEEKQARLPLPAHAGHQISRSHRATGPGGDTYEHWNWMVENDTDHVSGHSRCLGTDPWHLPRRPHRAGLETERESAPLSPSGQVIRRLFCKATAKLFTNKVRKVTGPHRYSVGMKQGPELLHKNVSAHIAIHKDAAMAGVDVKNVHESVEWGAVQKEIAGLDKNIWMWCAVLFQGWARAHVQTRRWWRHHSRALSGQGHPHQQL